MTPTRSRRHWNGLFGRLSVTSDLRPHIIGMSCCDRGACATAAQSMRTTVHGDLEALAATRVLLLEMIRAGVTYSALASDVRIGWKPFPQADPHATTG